MQHTFDADSPGSAEDGLFGVPVDPQGAAVVVIPAPFEATTSYRRGTRAAPQNILEASVQVDLRDLETGDPWRAGIAMSPISQDVESWDREAEADALAVIEAGGASTPALRDAARRVDGACERLNAWVEAEAEAILARGAIPAVLGGDHSVPFGALRALCRAYPGLGVLHIDAHADLRAAYEGFTWSHASIFYNAITRLPTLGPVVQVGIRDVGEGEVDFWRRHPDRVRAWTDPEIAWALSGGQSWRAIAAQIISGLPEKVYVSFDIDGLSPDLCPTTGTPVPGGLSWREACVLLRTLAESGRQIVGFDLCEVGPGEWDAVVGARALYKLAGWAIQTRG